MKLSSHHLLKACTLSVALLGSAAVVTAISMPDAAYAKSGNDNGGGNGNGGANGNGGGNGNGNGGGNGNSAKSDGGSVEKSSKSSKASKASKEKAGGSSKAKVTKKKKSLADELGVSASELGALNAAHANPNALKNASPNSRVGRIAAYRDSVLAGQALEAALETKQAELEGLTPPDRDSSVVQSELVTAQVETDETAGTVAELEQALADAGGVDAAIEADLAAARADLEVDEAVEAALQTEYDDAVAFETLSAEVDGLAQQVEDQPELERSLLEAASNKPVTDAVEAAVKKLLGL